MCNVQGRGTSQASQLHDQVNPPQASGDVGNNDSCQRTQPMTERDGKVWNRDAPLSHKRVPPRYDPASCWDDSCRMSSNHKSGSARFCKRETVKRSLYTTEQCSSLSSKDLYLFLTRFLKQYF